MTDVATDSPGRDFAIFAGGTGGHIYPALAVAEELAGRGYSIHWFGTGRGLEERVVTAAGFGLHILDAEGWRGRELKRRIRSLGMAVKSLWQAYRVLRKLEPVCALGMGGYVSGPAGVAAWLLGVPLVIHEQNSVAGTANRMLRRVASRVLCAYPRAFARGDAAMEVGNPVRAELVEKGARAGYDFAGDRALRLLALGGSLGARAINEALPRALALLPPGFGIGVRHQTGPDNMESVKAAYDAVPGAEAELFPFIEDMAAAYEWADLVLCRAGALTLAELTIMSRPSILVPLPHSIDDHQTLNARRLARCNGAVVIPQARLDGRALADRLSAFAADPARLSAMARAAAAAARPEATQSVADICEATKRGA